MSFINHQHNRRTRGQRRTRSRDRRSQTIWVENCRRRGTTNRRSFDRRPEPMNEQRLLKTVKPLKSKYTVTPPATGQLINISV